MKNHCARSYSAFNSLAYHLRTQHSGPATSVTSPVHEDNETSIQDTAESVQFSGGNTLSCSSTNDGSTAAVSFVSSLLAHTVMKKTVHTIIEHASTLVCTIVQGTTNDIENVTKSSRVVDDAAGN